MTDDDADPCAPWLACIPLAPRYRSLAFAIVQAGRAVVPAEGLIEVLRFHADGQGGWISAARAANGRWGYIDALGRWRVPPTLQHARSFSHDGLARFCDAGRWGFVNRQGQVVIAPTFEDAHPFRNGLCAVRVAPRTWRALDAQGRWAHAGPYDELGVFAANGLARAVPHSPTQGHGQGEGRGPRTLGFVDGAGRWAIKPRLAAAHPFGEWPVTPASADGRAWGLIDATGRWVLPPRHARIDPFNSDGLAYFVTAGGGAQGYLDTQGAVAVHGGAGLSARMACGAVAQRHGAPHYLTADGQLLAAPALSFAGDFSAERGFAVVRTAATAVSAQPGGHAEPARWGVLHPDGRFVPAPGALLEPLTDGEGWLSEALPDTPHVPFITRDGQLAGIDGEGEVVWRAHYDGQQVALLDAEGRTLWHSGTRDNCWPPRPFFQVRPADHLEALDSPDALPALATRLLDEARSTPAAIGSPASQSSVQQRRVLRAHLSDAHRQAYGFLAEALRESVHDMHAVMARRLAQRLGPPETVAPTLADACRPGAPSDCAPSEPALEWTAPPVPTGAGVVLGLREGSTPHGQWWEVWLLAAPQHGLLAPAWRALQSQDPHPPVAAAPQPRGGGTPLAHGWQPSRRDAAAEAGGAGDRAPRTSLMGTHEWEGPHTPDRGTRGLRRGRPAAAAGGRARWLLGAAAGLGHLALAAAAWGREGPAAAVATVVLPGVSELYWAWRFWTDTPASPGLALACLAVAAAGAPAARLALRRSRSMPLQRWR